MAPAQPGSHSWDCKEKGNRGSGRHNATRKQFGCGNGVCWGNGMVRDTLLLLHASTLLFRLWNGGRTNRRADAGCTQPCRQASPAKTTLRSARQCRGRSRCIAHRQVLGGGAALPLWSWGWEECRSMPMRSSGMQVSTTTQPALPWAASLQTPVPGRAGDLTCIKVVPQLF